MKRKLLLLGLITLMLAGGLILASCSRCPDLGICEWTYVPNAILQDVPDQCANDCVTKQAVKDSEPPTSKKTYNCNC
jgi:hypothetical protein